jgi:hypothetical protein
MRQGGTWVRRDLVMANRQLLSNSARTSCTNSALLAARA